MCDSDTEPSEPPGLVVRLHRVLPAAQVLRWLFSCIGLPHVDCFVCLSSCPSVVCLSFVFWHFCPLMGQISFLPCTSTFLCCLVWISFPLPLSQPSLRSLPPSPPLSQPSLLSQPSFSLYPTFPFFSRSPLPLSQASLLSQAPPPIPAVLSFPGPLPPPTPGFPSLLAPFPPPLVFHPSFVC